MDDTNEFQERLNQMLEDMLQMISFYAVRGALTLTMCEDGIRVINKILEEIDRIG